MHYMMDPIINVDGDEADGEWYLFQTCTFAEGNTPIWEPRSTRSDTSASTEYGSSTICS